MLLLLVAPAVASAQDRGAFEAELDRLRRELRIPALSAAVVESGTLVWVRHLGVTPARGASIRYPLGWLTQAFASALVFQLVERGALALDRPLGPGAATLRATLSHTSTGPFVFSGRLFEQLQPVIERAAGTRFHSAMLASVVRPAGLRDVRIPASATPSQGVEASVEDLARFASAVERGPLLSARSRSEMFRPARAPTGRALPSAPGWFVQYLGGEEARWHFGQDAGASALLLMLPRRRLTLAVLARTDRLSAPFWLQMGDVRWSPVAAAFMSAWPRIRIDLAEARRVMTSALIALHDGGGRGAAEARALVDKATGLAPALGDSPDGALLAAFARSGDARIRAVGRRIAKRLLATDLNHPRTLFDLAVLEQEDGQLDEARRLLMRVAASAQSPPEIAGESKRLLSNLAGAAAPSAGGSR